MDEEEFDSLREWRPFDLQDWARHLDGIRAETTLVMKLGTALWGTTAEDVQRQLAAPHPEIPSGFALSDFRRLLEIASRISRAAALVGRMRGHPLSDLWDARCEVARRAVAYLER